MTLDTRDLPSWAVDAKLMQFQDYFRKLSKDKVIKLPFDDILIIKDNKETRLFWLEGDINDVKDKKTFEEMQDFLKPTMSALMSLEYDSDNPKYKEAFDTLQELRELHKLRNEKKHEHSKHRLPNPKPKIVIHKK